VYAPGGVRLHPELLKKHQAYVSEKLGNNDPKPVFLVFHGGSGSSKEEFREAISYGVVKVNVDTDLQWGYLIGIRDYVTVRCEYQRARADEVVG
jgi:fructose-bisphosphate aldolase class II